jgi:hypothetical protein
LAGEGSEAYLAPTVHPDDTGDEEEKLGYDTFPERETRRIYPELFAAAGTPNVRELV